MGDWKLKLRPPVGKPDRVIFLVHGWTGDENSMWVFAPRMPKDALLIAPRAPFTSRNAEFGGYSWVPQRGNDFSPLEAFQQAVDEFGGLIAALSKEYDLFDFSRCSFVGFSQGAAFCFAFALTYPARVAVLAALAGFLPAGGDGLLAKLADVPIFMAHGGQDETVPVSRARKCSRRVGCGRRPSAVLRGGYGA